MPTVRDLEVLHHWTRGSREDFALRDKLNSDPRNARLIAAGPLVTTVGGYGGYAVISAGDAREKIDELIDGGADVIAVDGNPLERIDALRDVWLVVHNGEVIRNDRQLARSGGACRRCHDV